MKSIYLAGPLFSVWERSANLQVADGLERAGYNILLPQDIEAPKTPKGLDMSFVFRECVRLLDESDAVVAMVDGSDVDSGTAWELGYAYAKGIPSMCVRSDMRQAEAGESVNIMIGHGAERIVDCSSYRGTVAEAVGHIIVELGEMLDGKTAEG